VFVNKKNMGVQSRLDLANMAGMVAAIWDTSALKSAILIETNAYGVHEKKNAKISMSTANVSFLSRTTRLLIMFGMFKIIGLFLILK
jgi:hypothetical protein